MTAVIFVTAGLTDTPVIAAGGLLLMPVILDGATIALGPLEKRLGDRWVKQAGTRLRASGADVVAITGSYGKTTTKGYVAHLLGGSMRVVASPASFNNRMGLARAINEHLAPGTSVFIAEMGTYGPGEISEICEWIRPRVAAIVAVGPVHLERFRTEERIVNAKAEILDRAEIGVVAIDNPMLATIASSRAQTMNIITAGTGSSEARVLVRDSDLIIDGHFVASVPEGVYGTNLAVATGISLALGLHPGEVAERIAGLPVAEHRGSITISGRGVTVIDDTYNSNPAGAAAALDSLARAGANGKRVVVTPGMVELGPRQKAENFAFAQRASEESDVLLIVGRTNRVSLTEGASNGSASVTVVSSREDAVAWVRDNLSEGDAVLYENDLPDHYP
jgi:UDP-N-acetylmuramoyl-tripeptide--D-alanyl-D-alanine ligase